MKHTEFNLSEHAIAIGIINATPDSFSDGGRFTGLSTIVERALALEREGAAIIDIGGESSRPGAEPVSEDEELRRVIPAIKAIREQTQIPISVDTQKPEVAQQAILAGANIVNDINGLQNERMIEICAEQKVGVIIMHKQGNPETMQDNPQYEDVVEEVKAFFEERYQTLTSRGIAAEAITFDPGIGFGKTVEQNVELIENIETLGIHNRPTVLGVSRKSIIGHILELDKAEDRDNATAVITALARQDNCMIHRVHDVKGNISAIKLVEFLL